MKRVIIVQDSDSTSQALRLFLEESGAEIVGEAKNRLTVIRMLRELKPEIAIVDISLSESNSFEIMQLMKTLDQKIQMIVLSSCSQKHVILQAMRAGACSFIMNPFNNGTCEQVAQLIKRHYIVDLN